MRGFDKLKAINEDASKDLDKLAEDHPLIAAIILKIKEKIRVVNNDQIFDNVND